MDESNLLVRHAEAWAAQKGRSLDGDLLGDVVDLRLRYDDLAIGAWPAGSAERLLLVIWPAYGHELPDPDRFRDTLDSFWGFLRATGRMTAGSASPAELRKEARRALPKMVAAYDDPARHSQGRVLGDFGRSIGIELDGAADIEELQERLHLVQSAWNALPQEERIRRMPDPSPKGWRAQAANPPWPDADEPDDDDAGIEPGDVRRSGELARTSGFVQGCLALADWVGSGRPATSRGLLRPAVAREAYDDLGLGAWEREYERIERASYGVERELPDGADALLAAARDSWRSAGDCLPLDRLWYACDAADLLEFGSTRVRRSDRSAATDEEWRNLALVLMVALCLRLGWYAVEPMAGVLLIATVSDGPVPVDAVRTWWDSRCPAVLRQLPAMHWQERLDLLWYHFADCNLWHLEDDRYELTDLGRDFAIAFLNAVDDGLLGED